MEGESPTPTYDALPARDRRMVDEYLRNGMVQWKAYYEKVYSGDKANPNINLDSIRANASTKFSDQNIKAAISERMALEAMQANEVMYRLREQATGNISEFFHVTDDGFVYFDFAREGSHRWYPLIKKVKTKRKRLTEGRGEEAEEWEHEWVEVELYDAQAALKLIGQHHGLFVERHEHSGPGGGAIPVKGVNFD